MGKGLRQREMLQLIITVVILGLAVLIHELGHLIAALLTGIPVEKFSLGLGPMVVKKRIKNIDFGIAPIPFGGYVKIKGRDGIFSIQPKKRFPVLFMGPLFNIFSAPFIIIFIFFVFGLKSTPTTRITVEPGAAMAAGMEDGDKILTINGEEVDSWEDVIDALATNQEKKIGFSRDDEVNEVVLRGESLGINPLIPPVIGMVRAGGPADKAGLAAGDIILKVDDQEIETWGEMAEIIRANPGKKTKLKIQRGEEKKELEVIPDLVHMPDQTIGQIGVLVKFETERVGLGEAILLGLGRFKDVFGFTISFLSRLLIMKESVRNVGGPLAIAKLSSESLSWGIDTLLFLFAFILINLGIINLFPIPIFDGGNILLSFFEFVRKKKVSKNFLMIWQQIGFLLIIVLAILVTFNDLTR